MFIESHLQLIEANVEVLIDQGGLSDDLVAVVHVQASKKVGIDELDHLTLPDRVQLGLHCLNVDGLVLLLDLFELLLGSLVSVPHLGNLVQEVLVDHILLGEILLLQVYFLLVFYLSFNQ